jgi:ribose transport system substrate-binding protein
LNIRFFQDKQMEPINTSSTRRHFCRAVIGAAALIAVGCDNNSAPTAASSTTATAAPAAAQGTIGVSLLTLSNPFFREMGDAMTAEGALHGMKVQVVSADLDSAKQRDQVKNFIVAKVSAIILTPADSRAVGTAIQEANAAGIPVFTADVASLSPDAKVASHIATDNLGGGRMAGEAVVELLKDGGKVAIIDHPEVESVILRTRGFTEVVSKHANIQVVATLPGGGERDRSFKVTQDILQAHPDVNAIFAINDPSALGVVAALEAAGKLSQVKVIGFDGQPEAKIAIRDGKIYADAIQYPDRIGKLAVQAIQKFLNGEKVDAQTLIPTGLYKQADAKADTQLK